MKEITYNPLSHNQEYKASLENGVCHVKSNNDQYLESKVIISGDELILKVLKSNTPTADKILAVQVEYLLGLNDSVRAIKIENSELPFLGKEFKRNEFFQLPGLWHHTSNYQIGAETWTVTNERNHPVRPAHYQGTMYRRYVPQLDKTITFRLLQLSDLDTFHNWHNQPRVYHFWELNKPKEELKEYIEKSHKDPHQMPVVIELDNEPVGYFEFYWVREDRLGPYYDSDAYDRGFHFLIGNRKFLGYETTDSIIKSVLHLLFLEDARTRRVMAEPRHDNQKVLKYAEASIGWRKVKIFDFPHKRAVLLENSREIFFGGNAL